MRALTEAKAKLTREKKDLEMRVASLQQELATAREAQASERRTLLSRHDAELRDAQNRARDHETGLQQALTELRGMRDAIATQLTEATRTLPVEDRPDVSLATDQLRFIGRELTRRGLQIENFKRKAASAEVCVAGDGFLGVHFLSRNHASTGTHPPPPPYVLPKSNQVEESNLKGKIESLQRKLNVREQEAARVMSGAQEASTLRSTLSAQLEAANERAHSMEQEVSRMQERQSEREREYAEREAQAASDYTALASAFDSLKAGSEMEKTNFYEQIDSLRKSLEESQEEATDLRQQVSEGGGRDFAFRVLWVHKVTLTTIIPPSPSP
jgi:chromosome segregation ATPase